jgi:Zn-dependent peptidase ImmA (M78 family)/transcriptional regulator with XRE-family HTH domain
MASLEGSEHHPRMLLGSIPRAEIVLVTQRHLRFGRCVCNVRRVSTSVPALVEKELLVWARETIGLGIEEAAKKIGISVAALQAWESGSKQPTVTQLRNAASVYKRPLAVFYLPDPPTEFQALRDYRQLPGDVLQVGPQLAYAIRRAHQLRAIALDLAQELGEDTPLFRIKATLATPPAELAAKLRKVLQVDVDQQAQHRDARLAFNMWRYAFENAGVFVFQFPEPPINYNGVDVEEARGFSIPDDHLPLIAVNAKDAFSARTFTLFHELVHVAIRGNGICDLHSPEDLPPEERKVEIYCNRVAAETLVPATDFRNRLSHLVEQEQWEEDEIQDLSRVYSISREVVVRRLLELGLAPRHFYQKKRAEYAAQAAAALKMKAERSTPNSFKANIPMLVMRSVGRSFARTVLRSMDEGRITASDAAGFLGAKTKHFSRIQAALLGKSRQDEE